MKIMLGRKRSSGITFIGFLMLLAVAGFFAYLAMRLVPLYMEYMGVVKAMEQIRATPNSQNMSPEEIRKDLTLKFSLQYVDPTTVLPQDIQVLRQGNASTLRIQYERQVPFIYNIDLLAKFDKSVNLSGGDGG
jgi:hypothetical protein